MQRHAHFLLLKHIAALLIDTVPEHRVHETGLLPKLKAAIASQQLILLATL